jgi:hypothetical protein
LIVTFARKENPMIYVAYHMTAVPGKLDELMERTSRLKEIAESRGAKQLGGFHVSLGQNVGSLLYIVSYENADTYGAVAEALSQSADFKQAVAVTASSESAVLQPLPGSPIQ